MAEKKEKKITQSTATPVAKPAEPVGNSVGLRVGAIIAWVFAIGFEVVAILMLKGTINLSFMSPLVQMIVALVLDLACAVTGSLLWKKANHINPASKKNKVKFWLWNNLGLIITVLAFLPFIILTLTDKNADKKTKTIAVAAAAVALIIGGLFGYEWNPVSLEEKNAVVEALAGKEVYWSPSGKVFHTSPDCSHFTHTEELTSGTAEQAIAEGRTRLCKTCQKRDAIIIDDEEYAEANAEIEAESGAKDVLDDVLDEAEDAAEDLAEDEAAA